MRKYGGFTHEQIYGSLDDYCEAIGRTPEQLIEEKWREIEYLQKRYDKLIDHRKDMEWQMLCKEIKGVEHSKRKMLDRFERWLKKSSHSEKQD